MVDLKKYEAGAKGWATTHLIAAILIAAAVGFLFGTVVG